MIYFLSIINILISFLLIFYPVWFSKRFLKLPLLNPITLALIIFIPFQIMRMYVGPAFILNNGIFDLGYQYALLMNNIFYFSELFSCILIFKILNLYNFGNLISLKRKNISNKNLNSLSGMFLLIYLLLMLYVAYIDFGVYNWISNPREGYQLHRTGSGYLFALAISALSTSLCLSFLAKPDHISVIKRFIPFMFFSYLFGSKTIILSFFYAHLIFLWFINWQGLKKAIYFVTPVVLSLVLWNFYLAIGDEFSLQSIIEYFDYYKNASLYYTDMIDGKIELYYGDIFLSSFWSYIPRAIYAEKPFIYGILIINELYYPGMAELSHTPAFGGMVEQHADFGPLGVLFFGFFNGNSILFTITSYITLYKPKINFSSTQNIFQVLSFILLFGPNFGTYFTGLTYILLSIIFYILIKSSNLLSIKLHLK